MASSYHHALSSIKKWKGVIEDYLPIHQYLDISKNHFSDFRHRALRHHSEGIDQCELKFGISILNSDNINIPVRWIAEQHIKEDLGFIPSIQDWFSNIQPKSWMGKTTNLEKELFL